MTTTQTVGLDELRWQVLESLRGPEHRTLQEIPRRWPVLRAYVAGMVTILLQEGMIERVADPRSAGMAPAYRATAAGQRALDARLNGG